jgi:chloramphenicol 3-O phosphotransferase
VLGDLQPTWVAVRCAPEIAAQREHTRGDRPIGMTSTQTTSVHRSVSYAFEIDTSELTPSEALTKLCAGLGL